MANNAETILAGALSLTATTALLAPSSGAKFPILGANEFFPLTLVKMNNGVPSYEIVYVTARNVDSCTVLRAQEGTTALTFAAGDYVACQPTAGSFGSKADLDSPAFTGPASFAGPVFLNGATDAARNPLSRAVLTDSAFAYNDNAAVNTMDITKGSAQRWAPAAGAQTLNIIGWPPAGSHGELLIYGANLGLSTITVAGSPVQFINDDGTFAASNSLNTNHGKTLKTSGLNIIALISPDAGATRYCKVIA